MSVDSDLLFAISSVPLRTAVLCAQCEMITEGLHDTCIVCGSRSVLSLARLLGGNLDARRAILLAAAEPALDDVLTSLQQAISDDPLLDREAA